MKRKTLSIFIACMLLAAFSLVGSTGALDMDFTCGSHIVVVGDRAYDVLKKCGDPSYVESWQEVRVRGDTGSWMLEPQKRFYVGPLFAKDLVTIEEWEYDLGPNRLIRYLRFENGRLKKVIVGDYGY